MSEQRSGEPTPVCVECGGDPDPFACPKHPNAVVAIPRRESASINPGKLLDLCDGAVLNHCPNDPACEEDDPLPIADWCGVCLLAHDVRAMVSSSNPKETK